MADQTTYHPFAWLRRTGVKDAGETRLPLVEATQPVAQVADASAFFPPLLPPSAWVGGFHTSAVGLRPTFEYQAGARGAFVRELHVSSTASAGAFWIVTPTDQALSNESAALAFFQMSQRGDVSGQALFGDRISLGNGTVPTHQIGANSPGVIVSDGFYLAPGRFLYVQLNQTNATIEIAALIQEAFGPEPVA